MTDDADDESDVSTRADLDEQVAAAGRTRFGEVWLKRDDGTLFALLKNGQQAWVMWMRDEADPGYSSRNPDYKGSASATLDFRLGNGKTATYPMAWMIATDAALRAATYFFERGERAPWITWHDDTQDDM